MTTSTLTENQRILLSNLAQEGARIWRSPAGLNLISPLGAWVKLTQATVDAMTSAGLVREVETYGRDRGLYEISDVGRQTLALTRV